ncbi:hypothetical protein RF11_03264 [Thelohanellus kitauei]|uniref:Uncharacterized protein n=1 Tax=Thelohanellus kitauei TaxID=669202 RepID=A0A0C2IK50_THEKT|nr:hypothetical protein RF11_03264 [Thelohanellus kitauei]
MEKQWLIMDINEKPSCLTCLQQIAVVKEYNSFSKSVNHADEAAVKASYVISHLLVLASKSFSDGEMIKKCMLDESINITDIAQFAAFILVVVNDINMTEEFVELIAMKVTKTADDRAVSLVTERGPEIITRKIRMATKSKEKITIEFEI